MLPTEKLLKQRSRTIQNFEIDNVYQNARLRGSYGGRMTILSHSTGRRTGSTARRRSRAEILGRVVATTSFFLAVGFAAALVFGFLGH